MSKPFLTAAVFALALCGDDGPELYPSVPFATVADGKWKRPRAKIIGTVKAVRKEADGDIHVELVDGGKLVVLEIIPELKIVPPKRGQRIEAWGIVREDGWHHFWELHPLIGWSPVAAWVRFGPDGGNALP